MGATNTTATPPGRGSGADEPRPRDAMAPGVKAVGLIVETGAPEAAAFLDALAAQTGQTASPQGFLGLVPRKVAVGLLKANTPRALEWPTQLETVPL